MCGEGEGGRGGSYLCLRVCVFAHVWFVVQTHVHLLVSVTCCLPMHVYVHVYMRTLVDRYSDLYMLHHL